MYTLKPVANGNTGLFFNDTFCGTYSKMLNKVIQYSENPDQIFDLNICIEFMLQFNDRVYSHISSTGNQLCLEVVAEPYTLPQGVWTEHNK